MDDVGICNLALSRLGDQARVASINPPDNSVQAQKCAVQYPLARDVALEARRWGFNTSRETSATLIANPQPGWAYAYAVPNNTLKILKVLPSTIAQTWWTMGDEAFPFTREIDDLSGQEIILTNVDSATIVYQKRIDDATHFPPQFASAVGWLLASYIAGSIVKGDAGRKAGQAAYQAYLTEIMQASTIDASQSQTRPHRVPEGIAARGGGYGGLDRFGGPAPIIGQYGFYNLPPANWFAYPQGSVG